MRCRWLMALCLLALPAGAEPRPFRVYFVGNSVTDTINYRGLTALAASRGFDQIWGRHMIPGAPLFGMWEQSLTDRPHGFIEPPFGAVKPALENFDWDAVALQPFDRLLRLREGGDLPVTQGDLHVVSEIIRTLLRRSPEAQVYLYARWPRMHRGGRPFTFDKNDYDPNRPGATFDWTQLDDWRGLWQRPDTGSWGTTETREYFEHLQAAVNEAHPDLRRPVLLVPVGHVMAALDEKMRAGQVPGFVSVWQLYRDGIHLTAHGSYLVALTWFTSLYRQTPVGLPTEPYGAFDPAVVKIFQETVAEIAPAVKEAGLVALAPPTAP